MSAHDGKQNRKCQPKRNINHCKNQKNQNPEYLLRIRYQSGRCHSDCPKRNAHRENDNCNHRRTGEKLSNDNRITVDRLRDQAV